MQAVVLKGYNNGYELILEPTASFTEIKVELSNLMEKLHNDETADRTKKYSFNINTGMILYTAQQKQALENIFANYPRFSIHKIQSSVIEKQEAQEIVDSTTVHVNGDIIRNGQDKLVQGDLLFLGTLHEGGILRATGSIFVLGTANGVLCAGHENNTSAVLAGNLKNAQQLRIADLVDIVNEDKKISETDQMSALFVNDLHTLALTRIEHLKTTRPKLFIKAGGF